VILIGNKSDLASKREISEDEAVDFAKKNGLDFIECSAFNALNISLVFEAIVRKVIRERAKKEKQEMETPGYKPVSSRTSLENSGNRNDQKQKQKNCC
jgi:GTPase SAR1 family protein